jgi:hypothetical protein
MTNFECKCENKLNLVDEHSFKIKVNINGNGYFFFCIHKTGNKKQIKHFQFYKN